MAPIRVALIGLSASAKTSWAADAHLAYLLSPFGKPHYEVTALLNSSVAAAESAKREFKLPASVKSYGDPAALAADTGVDLAVCCTRVDVHFPTIEPSLRAGKAVFVEWPLTENLAKALELTEDKEIPDSIAGVQGRVSPIVLRLKEILASGRMGKVLSGTVSTFGNLLQSDSLPESLTYFADRKVGGSPINIAFGHLLDFVHEVLGEFESFSSRMQIQRPVLKVTDAQGNQKGTMKSDVPDLVALHGSLKKSDRKADVVDGAVLSMNFRHGQPFKGQPGLVWTINGEKGELRITAPGPYLMAHSFNGPINIQFHDHATDEVSELGWDWQGWQKELPLLSRSVAELYERYAEWVENGKGDVREGRDWPRLHDAVLRMREFDALYKQFDPSW